MSTMTLAQQMTIPRIIGVLGIVLLIGVFGLIGRSIWQDALQAEAYQQFGEQHVGKEQQVSVTFMADFHPQTVTHSSPITSLGPGAILHFPRGESFMLTSVTLNSIWGGKFCVSVDQDALRKLEVSYVTSDACFWAPESAPKAYFGSVDLEPKLGYPVTLHLIEVGEKGSRIESNRIRFTYEYHR